MNFGRDAYFQSVPIHLKIFVKLPYTDFNKCFCHLRIKVPVCPALKKLNNIEGNLFHIFIDIYNFLHTRKCLP